MNGEILKSLRSEAKLTQKELAEKLNISQSTIRMIEIGKRNGSKEVTDKIADYFDVSLDYLDGRSTERNKKLQMIDDFINSLIEEKVITNPDDIDEDTANAILNAVKAQVALKLKKRNKGDK